MKYLGIEYHLNDNRKGINKCSHEFFPKYRLLVYREAIREYICYTYVNSRKEAREFIKQNKWILSEV